MRGSRSAACLFVLGILPFGSIPSETAQPVRQRWQLSVAPARPDGALSVTEVLSDGDGVIAIRSGLRPANDAAAVTWDLPIGDAAAFDGSWWSLARPVASGEAPRPASEHLDGLAVDVVDAAIGDPDGDGADEIVVVFHRPFRETLVSRHLPEAVGLDAAGRSLHLGVYGTDLTQEWVAGTVFRPVSAVAACDGAVSLAFASDVNANDQVATGASFWGGFGFTSLPSVPDLPGAGDPTCADVNGDGRTEPVITNRNPEMRTTQ